MQFLFALLVCHNIIQRELNIRMIYVCLGGHLWTFCKLLRWIEAFYDIFTFFCGILKSLLIDYIFFDRRLIRIFDLANTDFLSVILSIRYAYVRYSVLIPLHVLASLIHIPT
jgi:hypothetical protein